MLSSLAIVLALVMATMAAPAKGTSNPLEVIRISSPDGSAKASFIPYGATATNFWVKDKHGKFRDLLLGFDNVTHYQDDALGHPYFNPIVGRYANRIRNGTFTIPISKDASGPGKQYQIVTNEHDGLDTLHGGSIGYDRRAWSTLTKTPHSVVFGLVDPDGEQGFPGMVYTTVSYELENKATWKISIHAVASKLTPIMQSAHHYWNLEAYEETQDLVGHHAQFASSRVVATDGILIPTGSFIDVEGTALDFRKAKSVGGSINATAPFEYCGTGCVGFDNCWVYDKAQQKKPAFSLWSVNSGIRMDITTNQPALQIYSCNGIKNPSLPIPRKASQGGPGTFYENHSCIVIEQESYIDAINNPEFGIDQIYGPKRPYAWEATYAFSILK